MEYITERTWVEYNMAEEDQNEEEQLHTAARRFWKGARDKALNASADEVGVLLAQARHEWKRKKRRIEYASKIRVVRIDVR